MIVIAIIAAIVIIVIVAYLNNNKTLPDKTDYYSHAQHQYQRSNKIPGYTPETETEKKQRLDNLFEDYRKIHSHKTLAQIDDYIESKRTGNDDYWHSYRMEYKVLMDYRRKLQAADDDLFTKKVNDYNETTQYETLLEAWHKVRFSQHFYPEIDFEKLVEKLEVKSADKFLPLIVKCHNRQYQKWINGRKREGHYIPQAIYKFAADAEKNESELEKLKRERKNYQTALSKAKKTGDEKLIRKYEKLLSDNTTLLNNNNTLPLGPG
jgi:hypothetical protein